MDIEAVYREVAPKLQSYLTGNGCSYAQACDIIQETFLRLWKRRGELSDDTHQISGLAFTIARNYRNDLARRAQHESLGSEGSVEGDDLAPSGSWNMARPGEAMEEMAALKRRLKATLGRMPVQLLEAFALSRLGSLSAKDIASGTGTSVANVKVRIHRAREIMRTSLAGRGGSEAGYVAPRESGLSALKSVMMLAAVDGEISREELDCYHTLAREMRDENAVTFDGQWNQSVRAMAYIGFLSEMLPPEQLVREFVRESGRLPRQFIVALEEMASADGDYSDIERACVSALSHGALGL